ncbi:Uncharacterised protein [Chlamydia abortus]|nr:Uncharacterised protein [Chlamydia abortus]
MDISFNALFLFSISCNGNFFLGRPLPFPFLGDLPVLDSMFIPKLYFLILIFIQRITYLLKILFEPQIFKYSYSNALLKILLSL